MILGNSQVNSFIILTLGIFILGVFLFFFIYACIRYFKYTRNSMLKKGKRKRIKGYLYVISNPSFKENIYKIGMTERTVGERIKELFSTGVPTPFTVIYKIPHENPLKLEQYLHMRFSKYRINKRREFFLINLKHITKVLKELDVSFEK